jgi:hypothetical protein
MMIDLTAVTSTLCVSLLSPHPLCSLLFGNLLVFFEFEGQTVISKDTRTTVFSALLGVGIAGFIVFLILRSVTEQQGSTSAAKRAAAAATEKAISGDPSEVSPKHKINLITSKLWNSGIH